MQRSSLPPKSYARIWVAGVGLALYGTFVLLVTMWPRPVDQGFQGKIASLLAALHRRGVPEWFGYAQLEFMANVGMFVPLGLALGLLLPRKLQWLGIFLLPLFSTAIEWTQYTYLAERFATVQDVIANSLGGWIGLALAAFLRAAIYARDKKVVARAVSLRKYS